MSDEPAFQVWWQPRALDALRDLRNRTPDPGHRRDLAQLLRDIDARLRREPLSVGEIYRSRTAVVEHLAVLGLVSIDFAVDTARKVVVVRNCWEMSRRVS